MWLSVARAPAPRAALLTRTERTEVDRLRYGGRRRDEWIAGRLAARRVLVRRLGPAAGDLSVVTDPTGAPRVTGGPAPLAISLSHDGGRVAVAFAPGQGRVAIDVCDRAHARRLPALLARLHLADGNADACAIWAALECALKLRGVGVTALLGARVAIARMGVASLRVSGLGATAVCRVSSREGYALAWAEEAA